MKIESILTPSISVVLLKESYTKTCLPITANKTKQSKKELELSLNRFPRRWPLMDKVLVLFAPSLMKDVRRFHAGNGPSMNDLFSEDQIKRIDEMLIIELEDYLTNNNHNVRPSANIISEKKIVISCPKPSCRKEYIVSFGKSLRIECSGCNTRFGFNSFKENKGLVAKYKIMSQIKFS